VQAYDKFIGPGTLTSLEDEQVARTLELATSKEVTITTLLLERAVGSNCALFGEGRDGYISLSLSLATLEPSD